MLTIPADVGEAMTAHLRGCLPNEGCGLLAGTAGRATAFYPVTNDAASPTTYRTNARDMLVALRAMRTAGRELLAVCHSHPTSAAVPSRADVGGNTYGDTVHVIVGLAGEVPDVRAWVLAADGCREVEVRIEAA